MMKLFLSSKLRDSGFNLCSTLRYTLKQGNMGGHGFLLSSRSNDKLLRGDIAVHDIIFGNLPMSMCYS